MDAVVNAVDVADVAPPRTPFPSQRGPFLRKRVTTFEQSFQTLSMNNAT